MKLHPKWLFYEQYQRQTHWSPVSYTTDTRPRAWLRTLYRLWTKLTIAQAIFILGIGALIASVIYGAPININIPIFSQ